MCAQRHNITLLIKLQKTPQIVNNVYILCVTYSIAL